MVNSLQVTPVVHGKRGRVVRLLVASSAAVLLGGACGGDTDERPAAWHVVSAPIVQPNCATSSCHSRAAAVAGLDFSTVERGYRSLVVITLPMTGVRIDKLPRNLVVAGNPDQSRVVSMLRAAGARRMPPDRPLAEADIALIERWIQEGAKHD